MKFLALYEGERAWLGSQELYATLGKLGIDYRLYELPRCSNGGHFVFNADEIMYYTESILNDIREQPASEYKSYVKDRCLALRRWAERGYIVHVV